MNRQFFKHSALFVLSVAVLYSGVAWAFEPCLRSVEHPHSGEPQHHHDDTQATPEDNSQLPAAPIIHCTPIVLQIAPAEPVKPFGFPDQAKSIPHQAYSFSVSTNSPHSKDCLWLEAVFRRGLIFSLSNSPALHLFLPVFQI